MAGVCLVAICLSACGSEREAPDVAPEPAAPTETVTQADDKPDEKADARAQAIADFNAELERLLDAFEAARRAPKDKPPASATAPGPAPVAAAPSPSMAEPQAPNYRKMIIGSWQSPNRGNVSIEFHEDGSLTMAGGPPNMSATYSWTGDDTFDMSMSITLPDGNSHEQSISMRVKSMDATTMVLVVSHGGQEMEETLTRN
ncbi:MAG: hypothetical protein CMJ18_13935 [Phycisphaeraceae bacterium]|nr:hypothetical protein [Phycisphaeraceae bacterium]